MRKFLTSYFYYSRGERNGVMLLMALSLGVLMVTKIYSLMNRQKNEITDFTAFEQEIATFTSQQASDTEGSASAVQNEEPVLFPFNPNNASQEDLIRLGLSPKVATTLIHFRDKGGRFFKKEDLKKIYGLKPTDYERLESYISLENTGGFPQKNYGSPPQYNGYNNAKNAPQTIELKPFDPNTATENELLGLGLDGKTVKVLLKYREKGGVFRTKEDLRKVYGLSDIDFLRISKYVQIAENQFVAKERASTPQNSTLPKKAESSGTVTIDLNRANLDDFLVLRGIGRTFASRIIEHRERLGGFSSLNQLKEVYGLPDSTLHSILPSLRLTATPHRKILVNKSTTE
jgi:DNA uptake protein ComE-like DNA-binding protein